MGQLEKPSIWRLEFRPNPDKHIVVLSVFPTSSAVFVRDARSLLAAGKNEALIFIHGYNVGFVDAVRRSAQIAYDLHFDGLAMMYSWPSEGAFERYTVDEANVDWSRPRFASFLNKVRDELGVDTLHLVAHSMGNRLLGEVLAADTRSGPTVRMQIRQVAFAAPDVDSARFKDLIQNMKGKAERFTLYASSRDKALLASKMLHKYPRAGDAGMDLIVAESYPSGQGRGC